MKAQKIEVEIGAELFADLERRGVKVTDEQRARVQERIAKAINYIPAIGVLGKTGAGKSSLCNALFGSEACPVSHNGAGTREAKPVIIDLGNGRKIKLIDVPGVGENRDRDEEYKGLYKTLLPELDCVLWVIGAEDRALAPDQEVYSEVIRPSLADRRIPLIFVTSQCDDFKPRDEWDAAANQPGPHQIAKIEGKKKILQDTFGEKAGPVCAVAAERAFGLIELVEVIMECLPAQKKYAFYESTKPETHSQKSEEAAKKGLWDTVVAIVVDTVEKATEVVIKAVADKVLGWIGKLVGKK